MGRQSVESTTMQQSLDVAVRCRSLKHDWASYITLRSMLQFTAVSRRKILGYIQRRIFTFVLWSWYYSLIDDFLGKSDKPLGRECSQSRLSSQRSTISNFSTTTPSLVLQFRIYPAGKHRGVTHCYKMYVWKLLAWTDSYDLHHSDSLYLHSGFINL